MLPKETEPARRRKAAPARSRVAEIGLRDVFGFLDARDNVRLRAYLASRPEAASVRNANNVSALMYAVYRRNHEAVWLLRERLLWLDQWEAAATGSMAELDRIIADEACDVEEMSPDGMTALQLASFFGRVHAVKALLAAGANPDTVSANVQHMCALHAATAGRHIEVIDLLRLAGCDVEARQANGETALDLATRNNDVRLMNVLMAPPRTHN